MKLKIRPVVAYILLLLILGVYCLSFSIKFIDYQYVRLYYPPLAASLRWLCGGYSVSIGDLLYTLVFFLGFSYLINTIKKRYQLEKSQRKRFLFHRCYPIFIFFLSTYLIFNIFWGLNYYRSGIDQQMGIILKPYSKKELQQLNELLIVQVNELRKKLPDSILHQPARIDQLQQSTYSAYQQVSKFFSFIQYDQPAVKSSIFSKPLSYLGISGYYNPFTGEAQINTDMPDFLQPFTSCHEVAHQLGYAKENEANWIGYLAASHAVDKRLQYAAAFEMMLYANRNLHMMDSVSAKAYRQTIDTSVKNDWKRLIQFSNTHQSFWEPAVDMIYEVFLKSHQQPEGLRSYEKVTALLIGYYKQKGLIRS